MIAPLIKEPVGFNAAAFHTGREFLRRLYHLPGALSYRARLAQFEPKRDREIRVNFGWITDPSRPEETQIGGGVKLQHLRRQFGEYRENFTILYIVSSILHLVPHVEELIRFARRRRIPVVWNQNGVGYPAWAGSRYPWFNLPMMSLIRQADFIVWQSEFCRACALRYLGSVTAPSEILWNPVDLNHFHPGSAPVRSVDSARIRLLTMGTAHSLYRVKSAIDCLAELRKRGRNAGLLIAGEMRWPGAKEQLRTYIESLEISEFVEFHPRYAQKEAPGLYASADILVHSKYKDPCPTVPIEAMACGVPVVGSRSGGMPELVPEAAGRLVDVPDSWTQDHAPAAPALADAVEAVYDQLGPYSAGAREWATKAFDSKVWTARHDRIFNELLTA